MNNRDRLRAGIIETAQALGIDPIDLATAISYETAGTFDPTKAGPTTKWGQHRGLIQFGEPQAQQYGVDWNDPLGSQLGPDGAVANYLRDTGVKPGMELLDIYSAINAGGVGRYDASDTAAGGAPGTVRDKVNDQMEGHRRKAQQLIGAAGQQQVASAPPLPPPQTIGDNPVTPIQYGNGGGSEPPAGLLASLGAGAEKINPLLSMLAEEQQPVQMMPRPQAAAQMPSLADYIGGFLQSRLS